MIEKNGVKVKQFYGMSSATAMQKHAGGVAEYRYFYFYFYFYFYLHLYLHLYLYLYLATPMHAGGVADYRYLYLVLELCFGIYIAYWNFISEIRICIGNCNLGIMCFLCRFNMLILCLDVAAMIILRVELKTFIP